MQRLSMLALLSFGAVAHGQTAAPLDYSYDYFDQEVALTLDVTRIAVQQVGGVPETIATVLGAGSAFDGVEAWSVPGWAMVRVGAGDRSDARIQALVIELAQNAGLDFASPVFLDPRGEEVVMRPDILVGFEPQVSRARARRAVAPGQELLELDAFGQRGLFVIASGSRNGFEVLAAANALAERDDVLYAEPDMFLTSTHGYTPNDPFFNLQWGLHNTGQSGGTPDMDMDAPEAWDITTGDAGVLVAVLDDGVQLSHPDLNAVAGVDFTGTSSQGNPGNSCDNHGTTVAGTIAESIDNNLGGTGVAPDCRVIGLKFTVSQVPCTGSGSFAISWLTGALNYCQTNGIRVTNNSNGLGTSSTITSTYNSTHANGIVHFSSTGNGGTGSIGYPSSLASVNAVGAINRNGNRASFSQFGPGIAFVAPGQTIATTDRTGTAGYVSGDYVYVDGTSYSSPYASGVAALILSVDDSLTADEVEQIMESTCTDRGAAGYDTVYGHGIVNAHQAVLAAGGGADPLAIASTSPASIEVLVPGTNQFLSINGTGFTGNITVTYAGSVVDPARYTVVSENLITLDPPLAAIGTRDLTVANESESDSTTVSVVANTSVQHQAGNGDDCNPISVAVGAPLLSFKSAAPVGWSVYTYYSFSGVPSVHPVITLCMGNNFSNLTLLTSGVIPASGYLQLDLSLAGAGTGIKVYTQTLVLGQGEPWPVSSCQSIVTAP